MTSFDELLNITKKTLNAEQIKSLLLIKLHNNKDRYPIYLFFLPFGQHLRSDYPSFIPFYENLQSNNQYNISNDDMFVHNLIIEMASQYNKGDDRLYQLIMTFFDKF